VRQALVAEGRVRAGVEHGVHRVGAPAPALLRAVDVEPLREGEADTPPEQCGTLAARGLVAGVEGAEHVVLAPAVAGGACLRGPGYRALGVGAVQRHRAASATQRVRWAPSPVMEASMTSPSRSSRPQCMPLPAGEPVSTRSPGSSRAVCEA